MLLATIMIPKPMVRLLYAVTVRRKLATPGLFMSARGAYCAALPVARSFGAETLPRKLSTIGSPMTGFDGPGIIDSSGRSTYWSVLFQNSEVVIENGAIIAAVPASAIGTQISAETFGLRYFSDFLDALRSTPGFEDEPLTGLELRYEPAVQDWCSGLAGGRGGISTVAGPATGSSPCVTSISLAGVPGQTGWFRSGVTVTLNPSDAGLTTEFSLDGGATYQLYTRPFTISQDGTTTVLARYIYYAGTVETPPKSALVKIDKTSPTITGSRIPEPNALGWNNTDVTVSFVCSDAVSGIDECPAPEVVTAEGGAQSRTATA